MRTRNKALTGAGLAAILSVTFVPNAGATDVGGYAGRADIGGQASCFSENWNGVTNSCSSVRWDIPLAVPGSGSHSPDIFVYVSGAAKNVSCTVQSVSQNGTAFANTGWVSPPAGYSNTNVDFVPGTVAVPTSGSLEVGCYISSGSAIHDVLLD